MIASVRHLCQQYPTVEIAAIVFRQWGYVFQNLMVPMMLFMLTQMLQFCVPTGNQVEFQGNQIAIT